MAVCGRVATSKDIKDGHSIKLLEDKWNAKVMNAAKRHIFDEKVTPLLTTCIQFYCTVSVDPSDHSQRTVVGGGGDVYTFH